MPLTHHFAQLQEIHETPQLSSQIMINTNCLSLSQSYAFILLVVFTLSSGCGKKTSAYSETNQTTQSPSATPSQTHTRPATEVTQAVVSLNALLPLDAVIYDGAAGVSIKSINWYGPDNFKLIVEWNEETNQAGSKPFVIEEKDKIFRLNFFPMIANGREPREGRWNFDFGTNGEGAAAITLGNGSKLQVMYQDSRLSIGSNTDISHYGLRCPASDLTKVKEYLASYLDSTKHSEQTANAWLGYTPPPDTIPCLLRVDLFDGKLSFTPLLKYKIEAP